MYYSSAACVSVCVCMACTGAATHALAHTGSRATGGGQTALRASSRYRPKARAPRPPPPDRPPALPPCDVTRAKKRPKRARGRRRRGRDRGGACDLSAGRVGVRFGFGWHPSWWVRGSEFLRTGQTHAALRILLLYILGIPTPLLPETVHFPPESPNG